MSNAPHITERHLRDELAKAIERIAELEQQIGNTNRADSDYKDAFERESANTITSMKTISELTEQMAALQKEVKIKHDQRSDLTQWFEHRSVYGELTLEQIDSMSPRDLADHCYERKAEQVEVLKDKLAALTKECAEYKLNAAHWKEGCDVLTKERHELRVELQKIQSYPVHSEPVGGAMAMQDIAHEALSATPNDIRK